MGSWSVGQDLVTEQVEKIGGFTYNIRLLHLAMVQTKESLNNPHAPLSDWAAELEQKSVCMPEEIISLQYNAEITSDEEGEELCKPKAAAVARSEIASDQMIIQRSLIIVFLPSQSLSESLG